MHNLDEQQINFNYQAPLFTPHLCIRIKNKKIMNRNQIIQTAGSLFAQKGITAVSIEQIAAEAGVSKKSVHTEFAGIANLLDEYLKQKAANIETAISTAQSVSQSVLETLILVMHVAFKEKSAFCDAFYKDLSKYPSTRKHLAVLNMKIQNCCVDYFMKCMEEGYFIPNENVERMAMIYMETIYNLSLKYQHPIIKTLIKGICTPKGLDEAARIQTILEIKINKIETIK